MKQELEETLVQKYPKIFCDYHGDPHITCMTWGFECSDGWYNLIDRGCGVIQHHLDWQEKRGLLPVQQVVATQVKEKFGTLRFYYDGGDEFVEGVVALMENLSAVTCEVCGNPGVTGGKGWIKTACEAHQ